MKKTLERFLKYWKKRNYQRMYRLCQKTWVSNHSKGELINLFTGNELEEYQIGKIDNRGAIQSVDLRLKINGAYKLITVNMICEKKAFKPTIEGTWGVNPISILN